MPTLTGPPPTKEVFIPPTSGTEAYRDGDHTGYLVNADGEVAAIELLVPHDFHIIVAAEIVWLAEGTVTNMAFGVESDFAGHGESKATHSLSTTVTRTTTTGYIYRDNISAVLTGLAALDVVGIRCLRGTGGNANALFLGVRFRYT